MGLSTTFLLPFKESKIKQVPEVGKRKQYMPQEMGSRTDLPNKTSDSQIQLNSRKTSAQMP